MKKIFLLVIFLVFSIVFVSGCGQDQKNSHDVYNSDKNTDLSILENNQNENIKHPFDAYSLKIIDPSDNIDKAIDILVDKCMVKKGYKSNDVTNKETGTEIDNSNYDSNYGILDLKIAKEFGYLKPGIIGGNNGSDFLEGLNPGKNKIKQKIFDGKKIVEQESTYVVTGSESSKEEESNSADYDECDSSAADELYKGLDDSITKKTGEIQTETVKNIKSDKRLQESISSWSDCMKKQGFNYASPKDPLKIKWDNKGKELKTAAADVQCKIDIGFIDKLNQITNEYQTKAIKDNLALFEAEKKNNETLVQRANEVIKNN